MEASTSNSYNEDISDIIEETLPLKSKKEYKKEWTTFVSFIKKNEKPSEEDFIRYFNFLKKSKDMQSSTIWKIYSMLNLMFQHHYDQKLQSYPRITSLLKSYNFSYTPKKASVFTRDEISRFTNDETLNSPYWLIRKAIAIIAVNGGLRCSELVDLSFENFEDLGDSYRITITRKKQVGEQKSSIFIIPQECDKHVRSYIFALKIALGEENVCGRFFKGTPPRKGTSKFINQPMGKHKIEDVGKEIANFLKLDNPNTYTSHCFRRTGATMAADAGATTTQLKRAFGWKAESTAMRYVNNTDSGALEIARMINSGNDVSFQRFTTYVVNPTAEKSKVINIKGGNNNTYNFY